MGVKLEIRFLSCCGTKMQGGYPLLWMTRVWGSVRLLLVQTVVEIGLADLAYPEDLNKTMWKCGNNQT